MDRDARGLNGRGCESVDMRLDCMTSVVATVVDQGNCILRLRRWSGNTVPAGKNSYPEWSGMTEARDAMASARIGWKWRDRVGFGSV